MSLRDPTLKMSKSHVDENSRILLTDTPELIRSKIKVAVTDSIDGISYAPDNRPGVSNLIELYAHMERRDDFESVAQGFANLSKKDFKGRVADCIISGLSPIRVKYDYLMKAEGPGFLDSVCAKGGERAREGAEKTLEVVRKAVGLR